MTLILPSLKIAKGLYSDTPGQLLMDDPEAEWFLEQERAWRASCPPWSHAQARAAFGLNPPADAFRQADGSTRLDKDELKSRSDIVEIYKALHPHLKVIERGRYVTAQCFMHDDQHASLSLNREKKLWYCPAGCCEGGDVISLIQRSENLGFVDSLKRLAEMV